MLQNQPQAATAGAQGQPGGLGGGNPFFKPNEALKSANMQQGVAGVQQRADVGQLQKVAQQKAQIAAINSAQAAQAAQQQSQVAQQQGQAAAMASQQAQGLGQVLNT